MPYELADREPGAVHRGPLPERLLNPPEHEMVLARRGRLPEPPPRPWIDGIWAFPFYDETRRARLAEPGFCGVGLPVPPDDGDDDLGERRGARVGRAAALTCFRGSPTIDPDGQIAQLVERRTENP